MALNLTPRSYHVDPTGRDYTLDPAPLLRAQERNFASQKETMQMVYETGRKGVEFAEYLGARQQLGRVKAQLSNLDPNDPEFAQRYSAIVSDNPLAFMNPNTAPVAKMALAPLAAASLQAQQQRDAMARITEQYQGRGALQGARTQGQMDVWQYKQNNAPPTEADKLGLNGAPFLPGDGPLTDNPPAPTGQPKFQPIPGFPGGGVFLPPGDVTNTPEVGSAPGVDGPNTSNLPTRAAEAGDGPSLFPDITESGDLGAGRAEAVAIHQAANEALPPGVRRGNDGALYERKSVGKNSTWVPYKVAPAKPTTPLPEGKVWVPELHEGTNDVKKWKAMAEPKESSISQTQIKEYIKRMADADPEMAQLDAEIADAKGSYERARIALQGFEKAGDARNADAIRENIAELKKTLITLAEQQHRKGVDFGNQALQVLDPKFVRAREQYRAAATGSDALLETPSTAPPITAVPAKPAAVPAPTVSPFASGLKSFK